MNNKSPPPMDFATRRRVEALMRRVGERRACEVLDIARPLLARAIAGLPIRRSNADVIRIRLDALDEGLSK